MAKNTFKNNETKNHSPKAEYAESKPIKLGLSPEARLGLGLVCLVLAFFLLVAFVSHIFTGEADQSLLSSPTFDTSKNGKEIKNFFGIVGAFVAHYFVFEWFGLAAFLIIPILFLAGMQLAFGKLLTNLNRRTWEMLFFLVWTSTFLGYFVHVFHAENSFGRLSGGIGYSLSEQLNALLGWPAIVLIMLALALFVIFFYRVTSAGQLKQKVSLGGKLSKTPYNETTPVGNYKRNPADWEEEFSPLSSSSAAKGGLGNDFSANLSDFDPDTDTDTDTDLDNAHEQPQELAKPYQPNASKPNLTLTVEPSQPDEPLTIAEKIAEEDAIDELAESLVDEFGQYDSTLDLPRYKFPTIDLLTDYQTDKAQVSTEELEANSKRIVDTLGNYGIGIQSIKATIGPTVTLYEIIPDAGVRISKIKNLEDDIALSLAALGIRIIAPIPGKGTIGIEVPNKNKEMVPIRALIASEKFQKSNMELPIVLGKTISNEIFIADLAKMPHLLMAGATGQGKSVGLNVIIASLIYKKHPSQLKFVMVDPKKVELTLFNKIERHFLAMLPGEPEPIITNTKKVVNTLNSLCIEMDQRYNLLKDAGCRNLKEYNGKFVNRKLNPEKGHKYLPYIVLIIDELADLMMTAGKEVEQPIARLAQLARAVGIHLIVATQRPSVNVITGIIKANFPARLSFKVTSKIDSRTILDTGGADQLVGQGDMLLSTGSDVLRLQCAFIDTPEVDEICDFIGAQQGYASAYMLPEYEGDESGEEKSDFDPDNRDPYFDEAARLIVTHQQGSTSLIQRRMKLGYNRAGRLIDQLEAAGIVGPFEGSKAREVLIHSTEELEEFLKKL
jgi:DNA segregation ATPase FtsK/SpoIIIE, S-DNA-T family